MSTGELSVLNCTKGDIKVSFDKGDPQEVERAKRIIGDMLKRGYIIFVEVKGKLRKVKEFDAKREEYIIADGPLYAGEPTAPPEPELKSNADESTTTSEKKTRGARGAYRTARVPLRKTKATGIAPTAGG